MTDHGREGSVRAAMCRFTGCDEAASVTVGVMPLCQLHQSYVLQLMDGGAGADNAASAADAASAVTSDGWSLISVGDLEL
jgi:hypothetical protein